MKTWIRSETYLDSCKKERPASRDTRNKHRFERTQQHKLKLLKRNNSRIHWLETKRRQTIVFISKAAHAISLSQKTCKMFSICPDLSVNLVNSDSFRFCSGYKLQIRKMPIILLYSAALLGQRGLAQMKNSVRTGTRSPGNRVKWHFSPTLSITESPYRTTFQLTFRPTFILVPEEE